MRSSGTVRVSCLVDTNIVIDFLRRRTYAQGLLRRWADEGSLAVSALTHFEVYRGIREGEEDVTGALLDGLLTIDVNVPIARLAGRMLGRLRSNGVTVGVVDAVIAATAVGANVPLLTNNVSHYPFAELRVVRGV